VAPVFSARYRVHWSETDAAGIVHFSNFFRYCERAEEDFLYSLGVCECVGREGRPVIAFPRVHSECSYEAPLRPGDVFRVDIDEVVIGNKSITYRFTIVNESLGRKSAVCRIVAVAYDLREGRSIPVPEELRRRLLEAGAVERERGGAAGGGGAGV